MFLLKGPIYMRVVYIRPRTNFHANKGRQRERESAQTPHSHAILNTVTSRTHIYIAGAEEAPMYTLVPIPKLT